MILIDAGQSRRLSHTFTWNFSVVFNEIRAHDLCYTVEVLSSTTLWNRSVVSQFVGLMCSRERNLGNKQLQRVLRIHQFFINSFDKTKFLFSSLPPTQHHSFFFWKLEIHLLLNCCDLVHSSLLRRWNSRCPTSKHSLRSYARKS